MPVHAGGRIWAYKSISIGPPQKWAHGLEIGRIYVWKINKGAKYWSCEYGQFEIWSCVDKMSFYSLSFFLKKRGHFPIYGQVKAFFFCQQLCALPV